MSSSSSPEQYVFGYGSLAAAAAATAVANGGHVAELRGHRRRWGVAMDNARDLPGYKWYRLRATGERPQAFVAFLDVVPGDGAVNGLCLPVDAAALRRLDARERNYDRVDVTERVAGARGRVWTYVGSAAGRARLARGVRERRTLVSQEYLDDVEHGFRALGADALAAYRASTDPPPAGCEVVALERIDLP
ncbi:gamma-glutamylcyclotransferase [Conexibacter arvalis]|uniref:Dephospho-CoA kinase n=1 Tax=Conexibacter arvalis TaxID=912552 RepID=A0A840I7Q0_9ACTN|nr:dephospho-CoA kinase [Conexibacter arvalis]